MHCAISKDDPWLRKATSAMWRVNSVRVLILRARASLGFWNHNQSGFGILSGSGFAGDEIVSKGTGGPGGACVGAGLVGVSERGGGEGFAAGGIAGYVAVAEFCCRLSLTVRPLGDIAVSNFGCAPSVTRGIASDCRAAELRCGEGLTAGGAGHLGGTQW